jgi:hypothetical protein
MLIGLCGKAGSGKDSVADHLVTDLGFAKISLAAPIKRMLNVVLETGMQRWNDRKWKEAPLGGIWGDVSPRILAQTLGTEWGRDCVGEDIWCELALQMAEYEGLGDLVIPDVRFDNEACVIRERGGLLLEVVRPGIDSVATHVSEAGVCPGLIHGTVMNDGTLEDIPANLRSALDCVKINAALHDTALSALRRADLAGSAAR